VTIAAGLTGPGDYTDRELAAAIAERSAHRGRYEETGLGTEDVGRIGGVVEAPHRIHWVTGAATRRQIAAMVGEAERVRAGLRACHEDLQRWIRWTDVASRQSGEFDMRAVQMAAFERAAMRCLRPWARARRALRLGLAARLEAFWSSRVRASGAIGLLTGPGTSDEDAITAGVAMQRAWLAATHLGLACCPLATLPLLALRAHDANGALPRGADRRVRALDEELRAAFGVGDAETPLLLLRVGIPTPSSARP
jgi:hypothetical protein